VALDIWVAVLEVARAAAEVVEVEEAVEVVVKNLSKIE
jgi:hypothetical protein